MRQDMYKVIIDLPRGGSWLPNHKTRLRLRAKEINSLDAEQLNDFDGGPKRVFGNRYNTKSQSDRLNPLRRFLKSRVGRLWNDVHAEISAQLDNRSLMRGQHVWTHVYGYGGVERHCFMGTDGKVYAKPRYGWESEVRGLYVHPVSGILCFKEPKRYRYHSERTNKILRSLKDHGWDFYSGPDKDKWKNFRVVDDLTILEKKEHGWFVHTFRPYEPNDVVSTHYSVVLGSVVYGYFKDQKYPSSKFLLLHTKQLSKKQLKEYHHHINAAV